MASSVRILRSASISWSRSECARGVRLPVEGRGGETAARPLAGPFGYCVAHDVRNHRGPFREDPDLTQQRLVDLKGPTVVFALLTDVFGNEGPEDSAEDDRKLHPQPSGHPGHSPLCTTDCVLPF